MKKVFIILTMLLGITMSTATVAAQTPTNVDIDATAEKLLDTDPQAVADGIVDPPADDLLPEGFMSPPNGTPEAEDAAAALELPVSEVDGALASESFPFDADPAVVGGVFAFGNLNFIVLEEEFTEDQLADFKTGAEEGIGTPTAGTEGSVEDIEVDGHAAVLITSTVQEQDVNAVVQLVALPVGNVLVVGTVVIADQSDVDPDDVLTRAQDLTLSGVVYLDTVADDA